MPVSVAENTAVIFTDTTVYLFKEPEDTQIAAAAQEKFSKSTLINKEWILGTMGFYGLDSAISDSDLTDPANASDGCGLTSFAMIASYVAGQEITPAAGWAIANEANTVTNWGTFKILAAHYGIKFVGQYTGRLYGSLC